MVTLCSTFKAIAGSCEIDLPLPPSDISIYEITILHSEQLKNAFNNQADPAAAAKQLGVTDAPISNGDFLFYEIKGNRDIKDDPDVVNNQLYYCYIPKEKPLEREVGNDIQFKLTDIKNIAKNKKASQDELATAKKKLQSLEEEVNRRRNLSEKVAARTFIMNAFNTKDERLKPQTIGAAQNGTRLVMYMKEFDKQLGEIHFEPLKTKPELNSVPQSPDSTASA